jgi:hypothetical protein
MVVEWWWNVGRGEGCASYLGNSRFRIQVKPLFDVEGNAEKCLSFGEVLRTCSNSWWVGRCTGGQVMDGHRSLSQDKVVVLSLAEAEKMRPEASQ